MEATRAIKRAFPKTIVLVLTASAQPDDLLRALKAGAAGYVLKSAPMTEIIEAIRQVLVSESPLNQEVAARLLMRLAEEEPKEKSIPKEDSLRESLSPRKTDVLRLMTRGCTNQQIARELLVSVSAIKKHVHSVISKLGVSDRTQAAVRAVELGVLAEREGE